MILMKHGPFGWFEKIYILQKRATWFCEHLSDLGIRYFRFPNTNIVTIKSRSISKETATKFGLVPDNHHAPNWYKIVVMSHVTIEKLSLLLESLKAENQKRYVQTKIN
jgi:hypothetical protein